MQTFLAKTVQSEGWRREQSVAGCDPIKSLEMHFENCIFTRTTQFYIDIVFLESAQHKALSHCSTFTDAQSWIAKLSMTSWPYFGVKLRKKTAYSYLKVT